MKELLKKAFLAPRGSVAQKTAIDEIAELFEQQAQELALVSSVVLPQEKEGDE